MNSEELDKLQISFNHSLELFMKSPEGDAESLVAQYRLLRDSHATGSASEVVPIPREFEYERLKSKSFAYHIIRQMRDRAATIPQYIASFILHGSFATEDFVPGWSDLDTMIVLSDKAFSSADDLQYVKSVFLPMSLWCYFIDPLAHHQLFFVTEFDIGYYPQVFLPLAVYREAMVILGPRELTFHVREDAADRKEKESRLRKRLQRRAESNDWNLNAYEWKQTLADVLLLPSYLLQDAGVYVYKRESFKKLSERFPDIDMTPMNEATFIMRSWKGPNFVRLLPLWTVRLPYRIARKLVFWARRPALCAIPQQSPAQIGQLIKCLYETYVVRT